MIPHSALQSGLLLFLIIAIPPNQSAKDNHKFMNGHPFDISGCPLESWIINYASKPISYNEGLHVNQLMSMSPDHLIFTSGIFSFFSN